MSFSKTLYGLDKKGGFKVWIISVADYGDGTASILVRHGKEGGKMQEKLDLVKVGKQGRNSFEQGVSEAEGKIKKQLDKGYRENKDDLTELPLLAMLAADYRKQGHRMIFPCFISDKYDGVRALAKRKGNEVHLESRTGQRYDVPHISADLLLIMEDGDVLDGELYVHGEVLQDITSAVKRTDTQSEIDLAFRRYENAVGDEKIVAAYAELLNARHIHELRPKLQFYVFDAPSERIFEERLADLQEWKRVEGTNIVFTDYDVAVDEADMKRSHGKSVGRGFEGIMLRNANGLYESGKRSADLQKYKEFVDAEFEIIDTELDKDGLLVFVCENDINDRIFRVIMGSKEEKAGWVLLRETFPGKFLTVKFQSRYKDTMLPQFPTGVAIRDCDAFGNVLE